MKNFLNNKFNLIIILLFAIVLGFSNSVFASFDISINNDIFTLGDISGYNNFYITYEFSDNNYYFYLTALNNDFDINNLYYDSNRSSIRFSSSGTRYYYWSDPHIYSPDCSWVIKDQNSFNSGYGIYATNIVYSTFDIKDKNGNVVFQGAPQEQAQELTLVPIVEQVETEKTMAEILGILPLVVSLLVSIIAIKKAISFLRSVLRAS